jgi:hypothetical protein
MIIFTCLLKSVRLLKNSDAHHSVSEKYLHEKFCKKNRSGECRSELKIFPSCLFCKNKELFNLY